MVTLAVWLGAVAALVSAVNSVLWNRHARRDDRRFAEHDEAIGRLNGGALTIPPDKS